MSGRRAPVQGDGPHHLRRAHPHRQRWTRRKGREPYPPGSIAWAEHVEAWEAYAKRYGHGQSAERIAQRCGFSYLELVDLLGREPATWEACTG